MMDATDEEVVATSVPIGPHLDTGKWYLRSTADHDTHRGRMFGNGTVMADCGLAFRPVTALRERGPALPGYPPDPDQVCPGCKAAGR